MHLYLIRHAQSLNNLNPLEQRIAEPPLTELGRRQARRLADWIQPVGLTRLLTSPFLRALETTEYIRQATGLRPEIWIDVHEQGGCVCGTDIESFCGQPGMTRSETEKAFPGYLLPPEFNSSGWWQCKPYETHDLAQTRALRVAKRFRDEFARTEERVGCVSHGQFFQYLVAALLGFNVDPKHWLCPMVNAAVTLLILEPESDRLFSFNNTGYLPPDMIS